MRITSLLFLFVLPACDLLEAATAEKPNTVQQTAIGDIFGQVATVAGVIDDPATTSNNDLNTAMDFTAYARLVAPASGKPTSLRRAKPAPISECVTVSGNDRTFSDCDLVLDDGRQCLVNGMLTRVPGATGNSYQGGLTIGGPTNCPVGDLDLDVYLEGPTDSPTLASGSVSFAYNDPSGDNFSGTAVVDSIAITGHCQVASAGELQVTVTGTHNGTAINNQSITLSFHDEPGCGLIYIE